MLVSVVTPGVDFIILECEGFFVVFHNGFQIAQKRIHLHFNLHVSDTVTRSCQGNIFINSVYQKACFIYRPSSISILAPPRWRGGPQPNILSNLKKVLGLHVEMPCWSEHCKTYKQAQCIYIP